MTEQSPDETMMVAQAIVTISIYLSIFACMGSLLFAAFTKSWAALVVIVILGIFLRRAIQVALKRLKELEEEAKP